MQIRAEIVELENTHNREHQSQNLMLWITDEVDHLLVRMIWGGRVTATITSNRVENGAMLQILWTIKRKLPFSNTRRNNRSQQ